MNYNFYASKNDKIEILEFILNDMDLCLYDLGSVYGQEICKYKIVDEITSKFDLENGRDFALTFQLWSPRHGGKPIFRKIDLNPNYCEGHTFRYSTEGWGLIQLYFGGLENHQLSKSNIGHLTEKRAFIKESTNSVNGKVSVWDWKEIHVTSRKIKYQIHNKMEVRQIGSSAILQGADKLEKNGITFS